MVTTLLPQVDGLTDRVKKLRERARTAKTHVSAQGSRLFTQAWKENEGEPLDVRRARMLERLFDGQTVCVRDWELIVGSQSEHVIGSSPDLSFDSELASDLKDKTFKVRGETEVSGVTEEDRNSILEDLEYWSGRSIYDQIRTRYKEILGVKVADIMKSRVIQSATPGLINSFTPDFEKVLTKGLIGIVAEAEAEISKLTFTHSDDMEKYNFLKAVVISLGAVVNFAHRHADLARELAKQETDAVRKHELEEIAAVCDRVPEYPAQNFREAIQSYWFIYVACTLETACRPSRLDQDLWTFYQRDLEMGKMTENQAAELLACLWVKINEIIQWQQQWYKEATQGTLFPYVTIGGLKPDGKDATNDLSYLILEVARQVRLPIPAVAISYHPGISQDLLMKGVEVNREIGGGIPAFLNGASVTKKLVDAGFSLEDARNIHYFGCVHPYCPTMCAQMVVNNTNTPKMLELALHNGIDPKTGKQLGPATGDPRNFHSYEEVLDAFKAQYVHFVDLLAKLGNIYLLTKMETTRVPLNSALAKDCISKGRDIIRGGLRYQQTITQFNLRGSQNVANSLVAMKKLVFEEKKITMNELLQALDANFEGYEELRQQLLAQPKWGNDDDEVDGIYAYLWDWTAQVCKKSSLRPWLNVPIVVTRGGATFHYIAGKSCGATPDGRKAGEPMADGNVSPMRGTDHKGPTAVINSASKLNYNACLDGLFNMKFPPYLLKTDENKLKLLALIKTFFDRGGYHLQFNMIDKKTLLDAKAHPENHRDLVVRVAGYSAYFVDLVQEVQDDIIARTEHSLS